MNILINALSAKQGGGQTYIRNLLANLSENSPLTVYVLAPQSLNLPEGRNIIRLPANTSFTNNPYLRTIWEATVLPRILARLNVEVLFCPGGSVPRGLPKRCKVVTTFQNMMPFDLKQRRKYPLGLMRIRNWLLERVLLRGMLRSDLVIFISKYAKSVVEARANGRRINSVVIPHGINPVFREAVGTAVRPTWLPVTDYLLYVSTLDVYKAQLEVVEAYGLLKKKGLRSEKLVLVGPEYKPYAEKVRNKIAELGLQEDVLIVGNVPHTDLPSAYRNARINIFASETENCPFILLEALGAGRPVLVSSCPPMPEFGGDAVVYFDPSRPEDLARKLEQVNSDEELMLRLAGAASERSAQYRWEETGRKTWDAFVDLLEVPRDVEATTF